MTSVLKLSVSRLVIGLLSAAALSSSALAQSVKQVEPEEESGALDTIVVTGTKRETELIDSGLSATVLDAEAISRARLRDFRRIDDLAPNVHFNELGQRGSIFITIRGVESNPFIINRAAVYIDGIPFRELSNSVLNQIESIEVLRGPQGTLYGANTESGLVIVNTKAPEDSFTGEVRLTGKSFPSGEGAEIDGFVSGPVIPGRLAGSIAFNVAHEDAYVKNLGTSTGETGQIDETFLQGRLRWTPTDRLTVNAMAYWIDMDAPGIFDQQYMTLNIDLYNQIYSDAFNGGRSIGKWTALEDAPKYTTEEELVFGVSAAYELGYGQIDLAASYREQIEDAKGLDLDLTATPLVSGQEIDDEDYSHLEIRFTSPDSNRFDYIVGASYYKSSLENTKSPLIGPGDLNSYIPAPTQRRESEDMGVFASANWYATSRLRLGAGLRYDRAHRKTLQRAGELDLGFGNVITYRDADLSETFDAFLPRVSVQYEVTDDFSVYSSAARGYIPGGFNLTAFDEGQIDDDILKYDSESLWSREIGFHWRWPEKRLRASGAIFYITSDNWQDVQVTTDDEGRPISTDYIRSDASIRTRGIELEASWQASDALSIDGHFGYVDAEYRDLQLTEEINVRGQSIQFVPEYDGGLSVRYEWPFGVYVRAEAGFTGEMAMRARGDAIQDPVTTLGLQIGYEGERFAARIFGENLTDERRASGLALDNLLFGSDGLFYSPLDAPRIIGAELEARF